MPNGPKNAIPNRELTAEFKNKWDLDLTTINNLQELAEKHGCKLVVRGGLATEAFAGGHLTRSHNDIDARFLNTSKLSDDEIFKLVEKVMETDKTDWKLYSSKPEKIEYREKEDERPFFNRRRLELYIASETDIDPSKRKLFYTDGLSIEVFVPEFYRFVAEKFKKLFMVNDKPEEAERESNLSDYTDLKRLINTAGFDAERTKKELANIIKYFDNPVEEAVREYNFIMDLLSQV